MDSCSRILMVRLQHGQLDKRRPRATESSEAVRLSVMRYLVAGFAIFFRPE